MHGHSIIGLGGTVPHPDADVGLFGELGAVHFDAPGERDTSPSP